MFKFKLSYVALAAALSSSYVCAEPATYNLSSGTKVIDIEAPNAAGVSHNQYNQFNVDSNGLILNNSASDFTHSTLGDIGKNNNLTGDSATVILNEVISKNRSTLNGFIEVGGQKADVVIANPNGITCSGCSFVNTNQAILTTGKVNMAETGAIENYAVSSGIINIEKGGLNAPDSYALLLADVINLTGKVNANSAQLSAGNFTLDNTTGIVTSAGKGTSIFNKLSPTYSIDISSLGGVTANSITMVGNNLGFGVRNKGAIVANYGLSMSSNGELINEGAITNNGFLTQMASAGEMKNTGTISNGSLAMITSYNNLSNTGTISGAGQMAVSAAGNIVNKGTIKAGEQLLVSTNGNLENTGAAYIQSGDQLAISALGDITQNYGLMEGKNTAITFGGDNMKVTGYIFGTETLLIQSAKDKKLSSGNITNAGRIYGGDIYVQTKGTLAQAADSQMIADNSLVAVSSLLSNTGFLGGLGADVMVQNLQTDNYGHIDGGSVNVVTAGNIYNEGMIRSGTDLVLNTQNQGNIVNRGHIIAKDTMTLTAKQIENGGYGCGLFKLAKCGVGNIVADTLKLNTANGANVGGTQSYKKAEINIVK